MSTQLHNSSILAEACKLRISFGENVVVRDSSFVVHRGEVLGIVGESGSGKSMTALSLMGLCPPQAKIETSGGLLLFDEKGGSVDITAIGKKSLQKMRGNRVSMIFQEPMTSLNPVKKCGWQVDEILKIHTSLSARKRKLKTIQLFAEVLLPDPQKAYAAFPHQLSGGQRQRVMIAMALACEPSLLLADEPTTALDVTVQKTILQLLRNLQKKYGMSVIFITHDLGIVREICDRVLVMYKGEIVEELTVDQLSPDCVKHPYTMGLLSCRPPIDAKPQRLLTVDDFMHGNQPPLHTTKHQPEPAFAAEPIVNVVSICKYFPMSSGIFSTRTAWFKAVDDVHFSIHRGETLGLVGESGCGKTTLSRTLLRLIEPGSGHIFFDGEDVTTFSKRRMRWLRTQAQIIFQDPYSSLNPNMTVANALEEPLIVHGIITKKKDRIEYMTDILQKVGLQTDDLRKYPHQFSGGQRQRVVIARALMLKPRFIICDEAVSALDVSVQAQVLNLLNDLKRDFELTYLFISHDLSVVKYMSDNIMVMQKGKIVESGSAENIFRNPQHAYTQKLIESIPGLHL